ncbi:glycoside hydrolase family 5 protein [Mycena floridula]|nr:glycoside hydrolase family 5 protein [Mycena floridula]
MGQFVTEKCGDLCPCFAPSLGLSGHSTFFLQMSHANELDPPQPVFASHSPVSIQSTPNNSAAVLPVGASQSGEYSDERRRPSGSSKSRRPLFWFLGVAALIVVVLAVILPVYFTVIKPKNNKHVDSATGSGSSSSNGEGSGNPGSSAKPSSAATTGADGSTITTDDGSTFTYSNQFGGFWISDPLDPFNNNAQPNSWTPPLNKSWTWGQDKIHGVNLGGWLVLEPFITPALFQKYPGSVDEWTLSEAMRADTGAGGGIQQLEDHYNTFITEQDIAQIAGAGLNWVRVPIPYWAIETWAGEPFLEKTAWNYFLRLISWCRKYGIRINLDLHTIPGSQNGLNHSGKLGQIDFLYGVMGVANAQRALSYIRILTEFISQPEYKDVIPLFSMVNEAELHTIGRDQLSSFYLEAHNMVRSITGVGAGNGPYIAIHDGFDGEANWAGFLSGSDRVILDFHPYIAFNGQPNNAPIATGLGDDAGGIWPTQACHLWADAIKTSQTAFGVTIAGEFSNGYNDCALYLRGIAGPSIHGDCDFFQDSSTWNDTMKAGLNAFTMASMDALQDWFFWTWKIGNSNKGHVEAPLWSYSLGLENNWIPKDPRTAAGTCNAIGAPFTPFDGQYESWQTGGAGAGTIVAAATQQWGQFPFPTISGVNGDAVAATLLPTYTATGPIQTLTAGTFSPTITSTPDGWFNTQDNSGAFTAVAGCAYPDAWDATAVAVPAACTGT